MGTATAKKLNPADLLSADYEKHAPINVEGFGPSVHMRKLSDAEIGRYQNSLATSGARKKGEVSPEMKKVMAVYRARMLSLALCDEEGTPYYEQGDEELISRSLPAELVAEAYEAVCRYNHVEHLIFKKEESEDDDEGNS